MRLAPNEPKLSPVVREISWINNLVLEISKFYNA